MKKKIGLIALTTLLVSFMAFSGVASAQASNVQILFFTQPGCAACVVAEPIVQAAAAKHGVSVQVVDYSTAEGKGIATANGVSMTPTIIITGAQSATFVASVTQGQMESAIQAAIGHTAPTKTPTVTPAPTKTVAKAVETPKVKAAAVKTVQTPKVKAVAVKTVQTPKVKAVAVKTVQTPKQPTIEVASASPTTQTQTVPEYSLLGLGAPALAVGAIYLFLRRR